MTVILKSQNRNKPKLLGTLATDIISYSHTSGIYPRCRDQVRIAIRTKHYSIRTEEAYVGWIKRYVLFHNKRHPGEMGEQEINQYLSHLAVQGVR